MQHAGRFLPGVRLLTAARMVRPGKAVADVGCDHGKLSVFLAASGAYPRIIATDIRPKPLSVAKACVRESGVQALVDCRLGDGLAPVMPGEVQDIVMAGMGGETMMHIIEAAPWCRDTALHFVLVPASKPEKLRRYLVQNGFALQREVPVVERGKAYSVLSAGYTGEVILQPSLLFCEVGLVPQEKTEAAHAYVAARLARLKKRRAAPMNTEERAALETLISEVETCLL